MKILKFGGTSVGSVESLRNVKSIIGKESREIPLVVVCSALSGVTNSLLSASQEALIQNDFSKILKSAEEKHYHIISELLPRTAQNPLLMMVKVSFNEIEDILFSIKNLGELSDRIKIGCCLMASRCLAKLFRLFSVPRICRRFIKTLESLLLRILILVTPMLIQKQLRKI